MESSLQLTSLLLNPNFWYLAGISLIIIEIIISGNFTILGFGVGALLTGATIDFSLFPLPLIFWERIVLLFSVISSVTLLILKKFIPKGAGKEDINKY